MLLKVRIIAAATARGTRREPAPANYAGRYRLVRSLTQSTRWDLLPKPETPESWCAEDTSPRRASGGSALGEFSRGLDFYMCCICTGTLPKRPEAHGERAEPLGGPARARLR